MFSTASVTARAASCLCLASVMGRHLSSNGTSLANPLGPCTIVVVYGCTALYYVYHTAEACPLTNVLFVHA